MPLNEAQGFHHSNLTEKQQREAQQAIYGLEERAPAMTPDTLTYEERVKMRRYLDQLDQKEAAGIKDFDLNKPPTAPYVYREFPRLMYHHDRREARPAANQMEKDRMLAEGWAIEPFPSEPPPEIPLTAAEHAEADFINSKLEKRRK